MSVKIKLKRLGKIRNPQYRIVIADSRTKRGGRSIEEIGVYHPMEEPSLIRIESERAQYWLGVGAQPTEAVAVLLKITGDWQKFKGLPGAEGTLRVAAPKPSRAAIFEIAAKEAADEPKAAPKPKKVEAPVVAAAAVVAEPAAAVAVESEPVVVAEPESAAVAVAAEEAAVEARDEAIEQAMAVDSDSADSSEA